jgi:thioredoxin reductase (NADPH)
MGQADPSAAHPAEPAAAVPHIGDAGRQAQTFPTLTAREIDRIRRFGMLRRYRPGEVMFATGAPSPGMFVILSGHTAITQHDGFGHVSPVVEQGPGQFLAEVGTLSGQPALVDGHAEDEVEVLLVPPESLRALLIAEAELGERIMRALILRRVALIGSGAGGPVFIGAPTSTAIARLENFLDRNGHPHHLLDPATDAEARDVIARYAPSPDDMPLVVVPDGSILRNPGEAELARALHMVARRDSARVYDVAVVGAGPAGLSTAVYAGSEGLSVAVLDKRAYGGQAGASARIENYLGFPTGISGGALAGRAFVQAQKFGADIQIPVRVTRIDCSRSHELFVLTVEDGDPVLARTVVVASGAYYRRPAIDRLAEFEGRGVWYWASPVEARLCAGEEVILVGGGNSAGQAAVFLSAHARKVKMMVRGPGLAASMSRYLIDRIEAADNIELLTATEVVGLEGAPLSGLERIRSRNVRTGVEQTDAIGNLFLFCGADPATGWLKDCGVRLDGHGFVVTGSTDGNASVPALQSTVAGVYAVGDVRSGSVKRVGAAIGEGANVVPYLHAFLAANPLPEPSECPHVEATLHAS